MESGLAGNSNIASRRGVSKLLSVLLRSKPVEFSCSFMFYFVALIVASS